MRFKLGSIASKPRTRNKLDSLDWQWVGIYLTHREDLVVRSVEAPQPASSRERARPLPRGITHQNIIALAGPQPLLN